jgi:hypothetical protein
VIEVVEPLLSETARVRVFIVARHIDGRPFELTVARFGMSRDVDEQDILDKLESRGFLQDSESPELEVLGCLDSLGAVVVRNGNPIYYIRLE